jgi:hypothetical protein
MRPIPTLEKVAASAPLQLPSNSSYADPMNFAARRFAIGTFTSFLPPNYGSTFKVRVSEVDSIKLDS